MGSRLRGNDDRVLQAMTTYGEDLRGRPMMFPPSSCPRLIVKIGSALLVDPDGSVRRDWLAGLVAINAVAAALMVASIDYLTLVLSGSILLAGASGFLQGEKRDRSGFVLAVLGLFLFIVGTVRAFQSAFGL